MSAALFNALFRLFVFAVFVAIFITLLTNGNREGVVLFVGGFAFGALLGNGEEA